VGLVTLVIVLLLSAGTAIYRYLDAHYDLGGGPAKASPRPPARPPGKR
jgi:hypothetical protein